VNWRDTLAMQLRVDEGVRAKPYADTVGKTTIGVGRNLTDVGLRPDEIDYLLANDMREAETLARTLIQNFEALSDARKTAVTDMAFNLGRKLMGFAQTLAAIREERWDDAAQAMLDSKWAQQVGERAQRLAKAMREG
jgi:lysozyme